MIGGTPRIMIYRLGSLGDTIMALPVFNKIRELYPKAEITLLTNKPVSGKAAPLESVLGDQYFFDRVLAYPLGTRSVIKLMHLATDIRRLKIDKLFYLAAMRTDGALYRSKLRVLRDAAFFKAAGVKAIIGMPSDLRDMNLTTDEHTGMAEWEARRLARRFESLASIDLDDEKSWDMRFSEDEVNEAAKIMLPISPDKVIIAVSIGTKTPVNDWEGKNWQTLLDRLALVYPHAHLLMLGGQDEHDIIGQYASAWSSRSTNLCGKTSPRVSGALLKNARVFIGHDSGPMHLAAAVGTPCVITYSARHYPGQWFPRMNAKHKLIYHRTDCAGCELEVCVVQRKKCILSITVDEVASAIDSILNKEGDLI